jgi:hypothetical protein
MADKETAAAPILPAVEKPADAAIAAPANSAAADAPSPQPNTTQPEPQVPAEPERTPTLLEKFDAEKAADAKPADKPAEAAKAADAAKPAEPAKDAAKPAETKAAEAPKPAEGKAAETKPAEAAKPAEQARLEPVEYKYTLPETLKIDDARKTELHAAFDEFRTNPAEGSQKLIDLHNKAMTEYAEQTRRDQFKTFNDTKAGWETNWLADPEIGGAGHRTALKAIARVRDDFVSSAQAGTPKYESDWKDFKEFLAITGAGSHPAFARLIHNLSGYVTERTAEQNPVDIKPPKDIGRAPGSFKETMYDNPRSHSNGRS